MLKGIKNCKVLKEQGMKRNIRKIKFSLIEILVVLVIILLLLSFLLPIANQIQNKAHTLRCTYNLKSLAQTMMLYGIDNDMFLPGYRGNQFFGRKAVQTSYWHGHLAPYLFDVENNNWDIHYGTKNKEEKIIFKKYGEDNLTGRAELKALVCPRSGGEGRVWVRGAGIPTSYIAINTFFGGTRNSSGIDAESIRLTEIKNPQLKILLYEGNSIGSSSNQRPYGASSWAFYMSPGSYGKSSANRHQRAFLHDDVDEFWVKIFGGYKNGDKRNYEKKINNANRLQNSYACITHHYGVVHISHIVPEGDNFTYFDSSYRYMTGKQNNLYGDLHVEKKSDFFLNYNWASLVNNN